MTKLLISLVNFGIVFAEDFTTDIQILMLDKITNERLIFGQSKPFKGIVPARIKYASKNSFILHPLPYRH